MKEFKRNLLAVIFIIIGLLMACTSGEVEEIDCTVSGPSLIVEAITDAECIPNGIITLEGSGGTGELMYSIDGIDFQASPTFSGLSAGVYTIIVADDNDCKADVTATVQNTGTNLSAIAEPSASGGCETGTGTITINASGGSGAYSYRLGNGDFITNNIFDNVAGGDYNITVKDEDGCTVSVSVKMQSGVSWSQDIKNIIDTNCSIATCHGDNPTLLNWNNFSTVQNNATAIRSTTQSGAMPEDGTLTQSQIDRIACWVDDGALDN